MKKLAPILWCAVSLSAATIGDTDTTATTLQSGDGLAFEILTSSFAINAARFRLPRNPTGVSFTFVIQPVASDVPFSAWLQSPDGAVSVPFAGPLYFTPGWFSSASRSGPVSTISGYLHLTTSDSLALFGTGSATLLLVNDGPATTLGWPPSTLHSDLTVSLTGGPLSVGAVAGTVTLQSAAFASETSVPEPGQFPMLAVLLLSFGHSRTRLSVRLRASCPRLKSQSFRCHLIC